MSSGKLPDRVREVVRRKHYSIRTEEAYVRWGKRFILFHHKRHPDEMGAAEMEAFLTYPAVEECVLASTQNQAFSALLFLYHEVLKQLPGPIQAARSRRDKRISSVLTREEVRRVLRNMTGVHQRIAKLLYSSGLRLLEALRLRVKEIDFERRAIIVRNMKGNEDRVTMLSESLVELLRAHLQWVKCLHEQDPARGNGGRLSARCAGTQVSQRHL